MNRPVSIVLILLAAAGGFAAGWWPLGERETVATSTTARAESAPAVAMAVVLPNEDAPPSLPELNTVEECREFLRTSGKRFSARHPLTRRAIRDYALRRWLELDAESALQEAERQPGNEFAENGFAPELFRVWLDLNVDSAIEGWTQANPLLAKNVRAAFLTTLAEKDPARAFELCRTTRGENRRGSDVAERAILGQWAQTDPETALKHASSPEMKSALWRGWAFLDPAAAFDRMRAEYPAYDFPLNTVHTLLPYLTANRPAEAAALIAEANKAGGAVWSIASGWLIGDSEGALKWALAQSASSPLAMEVKKESARKLATSEPLRALEVMKQFEASASAERLEAFRQQDRGVTLREAFASLAATDPAKAQELLAADPELAKSGGVAGYLTYAFAGDADAAIQQTREWLRDPALKEAAADGALMAFHWDKGAGARDPSQLLAAIPELADKVDEDVLEGWAKANPTGAAEFMLKQLAAGREIDTIRHEGVLAELAISRPEYTGLWLQRLPDPELQEQAAKTLAANWSAFDPEAAAAWINSLPPGPLRDAAAREMAADQEGP